MLCAEKCHKTKFTCKEKEKYQYLNIIDLKDRQEKNTIELYMQYLQ